MKFFNIDCHVSVIADIKNIFSNLGHDVVSWSLSGHAWVFNESPKNVDIIGGNLWRGLDQEMCDKFYERYKDELDHYDGFIVTYPTPFALLYEKFNKPIIVQIPIRYEYPFTPSPEKWKWLNEYLTESKNVILIANNKYDKSYIRNWIDVDVEYIPSLCEYTNSNYDNRYSEWLLNSRLEFDINGTNIFHKKSKLNSGYSWEEFYQYAGLVEFPYCNSTMSIFEQYTAGFPMLFPSKELMKELYFEYLDLGQNSILHEMTFNRLCSVGNKSSLKPKYSDLDPNDFLSEKTIDNFLNLCDYYDNEWMPAIKHFDNFEQLVSMTKTPGTFENDNREFRRDYIYTQWNKILQKLK